MKYKILLPLLVSVVTINACSKEETKNDTTPDTVLETYVPGTTMEIKELAIYTKDTVIYNPEVIQGFLDRNVTTEEKGQFYLGSTTIPVPESNTTISFLNNSRIRYNGINMEIAGYKDSMMLISEYTSTLIPGFSSSCVDLLNKVPQYNPYLNCPDGSCGTYRKTYPLLVSGVNYIIPLLTYAVRTSACAATQTDIPAMNIKNTDLKSTMQSGDTVLVQYANLPLVKK